MTGGERNEVGETFQRESVAVFDEVTHCICE
jgi:hypothetical protein